MRLVESSIDRFESTLARPVGNARASWPRRTGLLVTLIDADGLAGQGEASPLPGFSPDDIDACQRVIAGAHAWIAECDPALHPRAAVTRALAPRSAELAAAPAARFALETALFDLLGQRAGRSIAELLRQGEHDSEHRLSSPVGGWASTSPRVALGGLVPAGAVDLLDAARSLMDRGIRTIKFKVGARGVEFDRQLADLEALRRDLPADVVLRLDANGSWTLDEARHSLGRLAPIEPEWVEEPTAGDALLLLGPSVVPWAADESLADPVRASRLIEANPGQGCAAVVIKPALLGGLCVGWDLARRAQERGLAVVITHLFDGPVALASACELALALPRQPAACGLDVHDGLSAWPSVAIPQIVHGSTITPSGLPGLGLPLLRARRASKGGLQ